MEQINPKDDISSMLAKAARFDQLQYLILVSVKIYLISTDDQLGKEDKKNIVVFLKNVTRQLFYSEDQITKLINEGTETITTSKFFTSDQLPGGKTLKDCRENLESLFKIPTVEAVQEIIKPVQAVKGNPVVEKNKRRNNSVVDAKFIRT